MFVYRNEMWLKYTFSLVLVLFLSCDTALSQSPTKNLLLVDAAKSQIGKTIYYDGSYQRLTYPGGDVPLERGVCTDVLIRAFRTLGIDLQKLVHEDMKAAFGSYPKNWGLSRPDSNIDHRRVPNLMQFFKRSGKAVAISSSGSEYLGGDIVAWKLSSGVPHIGIVSDKSGGIRAVPLVIHNIGAGTRQENALFSFEIIGHYRYFAISGRSS